MQRQAGPTKDERTFERVDQKGVGRVRVRRCPARLERAIFNF